ncbi:cyclic-phosphate processing receiver domain-containing protein [Paenibacillus sp. FSL H8-0104]
MAKQINLYVDDLRECPEGFILARTYDEPYIFFKQVRLTFSR